jgi:hypothetical protein
MREERGADPRPACSAGRTGGPLHAVLVTHPPRLLHARTGRTLSHPGSVVRDFSFSSQLDPAAPGGPAFVLRRAPPPAPAGPSFARKAALAFAAYASARVPVRGAPAADEHRERRSGLLLSMKPTVSGGRCDRRSPLPRTTTSSPFEAGLTGASRKGGSGERTDALAFHASVRPWDGALGGLARFHAARPVVVVAVACHAARWVPQRGRA